MLKFNENTVAIAENRAALEELIEFFNELVEDEDISRNVKELIDTNRKFYEEFEELLQVIGDVVERFEHGHELRGKCDCRPKFLKVRR